MLLYIVLKYLIDFMIHIPALYYTKGLNMVDIH